MALKSSRRNKGTNGNGASALHSVQGSEDPTRASLPFFITGVALDTGHEPAIILAGNAGMLMNDTIAGDVQGVGFPRLKDFTDKATQNQVPIYV